MLLSPELNAVMIQWFTLSMFLMKAIIAVYAVYIAFMIFVSFKG